jgi:NAD(P)-dependent dehydrogenase (short-subunit alcohol dehydrogenase family)
MPISFENRAIIVTGAGGALGRCYALDIARRGGAVIVNDLGGPVAGGGFSTESADKIVAEIKGFGGKAVASYDTVTTREGAQKIAATAIEAFGRIDGLINNAGNMRAAHFEDTSADDLAALIAVHLTGSFNVTQAVWPHMQAQNYGRVVFTASTAGILGRAGMSAYGAAKGGVLGLMNVLAQEGAAHGILCNIVLPNAVSRMTASIGSTPEEAGTKNPHFALIGSRMAPDFTTGLAVYLASEACTTTHDMYSSLGGRIARAFIGLTEGWLSPDGLPPSAEDIAANSAVIRDPAQRYHIPAALADEYGIVVQSLQRVRR